MFRRSFLAMLAAPRAPPVGRAKIGMVQFWFAGLVTLALVLAGIIATPNAATMLLQVPTYLPIFSASMITINFMLATLLFIKGTIAEDGNSIRLGSAYLYVCFIIFPQTASFPGGVMPNPLIGGPGSPVWIWCFWHTGFALAIIYYALCAATLTPKRASAPLGVIGAFAATVIATFVATTGLPILPPFLADGHTLFSGATLAVPITVLGLTLMALGAVARLRGQTPEQLWLTVGLVASCFDVWLTWHGTSRFSLGWYMAKAESLLASVVVLTSMIHEITWLYNEAAASNRKLAELAHKDGLTGITNRRGFDEKLEQEFRRARREETSLGLILLDVDSFKSYNDRYGHQAGDDCLRRISRAVTDTMRRAADEVARYGGEEIAVLLPQIDQNGVLLMAEAVRAAVAALKIEHLGSPFGIATISAGAISAIPIGKDATSAGLVSAADAALYLAKSAGRNRICGEATSATLAFEQAGQHLG